MCASQPCSNTLPNLANFQAFDIGKFYVRLSFIKYISQGEKTFTDHTMQEAFYQLLNGTSILVQTSWFPLFCLLCCRTFQTIYREDLGRICVECRTCHNNDRLCLRDNQTYYMGQKKSHLQQFLTVLKLRLYVIMLPVFLL